MSFNKTPSFWLVWNNRTGRTRYVHKSEASAIKEAQRLADLNPDKKYFVLMGLGKAAAKTQSKPTLSLKKRKPKSEIDKVAD